MLKNTMEFNVYTSNNVGATHANTYLQSCVTILILWRDAYCQNSVADIYNQFIYSDRSNPKRPNFVRINLYIM
jgi:hypothetical protein